MENGIRPPIQMAVDSMRSLCLGYTGEANAQLIQIDVIKWQEKWPGASIDLMLALPGEKASYPAKTELRDGKLLFLPGYGDTQKPGHGAAYVVATKDGTHLAASDTVLTEIMHKGRGGDELPEAPEAQAGWVADVLDAAHRAEEATKRAENAGGGTITDEQVGKAVEDYLQENPVEVPAYELPTASAEVKGGVMVGKGLRMDGNVLGVVPNEPILIRRMEISAAVSMAKIDKDDNGKSFSLKNAIVYVDVPQTADSTATAIFIGPVEYKWTYYSDTIQPAKNKVLLRTEIKNGGGTKWYGSGVFAPQLAYPRLSETSTVYADTGSDTIKKIVIHMYGTGIPAGTTIEICGVRADA